MGINLNQQSTVAELFQHLDTQRHIHLERARQCSALTIPSLLPPEGHDENHHLPTPYQSVGAEGVNTLASKLLLSLFPPNTPFFRISIDAYVIEDLKKKLGEKDFKTRVESKLGNIERAIQDFIETRAIRIPCFKALRHLIVTGGALVYLPDSGDMKIYRLDQYVVKRDPFGNVIQIVIQEKMHPDALDEELYSEIENEIEKSKRDKTVDLYTNVYLDPENNTMYKVEQEVAGKKLEGSEGTYKAEELPWIVLRWTDAEGEAYGRGHVEEFLGDLISLESLSQSIVEGSAALAKLLFLINPNGVTDPEDLENAPNTGCVPGRDEDVTALQANKYADFKVTMETANKIEQRLSRVFLSFTSIQRDAERVTAQEIRYMAQQLEDALGGIFSILSLEFQYPLVKRIMAIMRSQNMLPKLPNGITMQITTGMEALGRGHDLNKLMQFTEILQATGDPKVWERVKKNDYIRRAANALGIDTDGLIVSDEEWAAMQNQQHQANVMEQAIPGVVQEGAKAVAQGAVQNKK
jgi:hypothetical protein